MFQPLHTRRARFTVLFVALILTALLCAQLTSASATGTWIEQDSGTPESMTAVAFADAIVGWAVGGSGTIVHTANGGATWAPQASGTTAYLYSVSCFDSATAWAVGASGAVVHTTNGGATWTPQVSGTTAYLASVDFVDANTGWAVGQLVEEDQNGDSVASGLFLKTVDGGTTWTKRTFGEADALQSVSFVDASTGWMVGSGRVYKTVNGGTNWVEQETGGKDVFAAVTFINADTGWVVGKDAIRKTSNGGGTWTEQYGDPVSLVAVSFSDANTGWAVGTAQVGPVTALRTVNAGATWTPMTPPGGVQSRYGVACVGGSAWLVGSKILNYSAGGSSAGVATTTKLSGPTTSKARKTLKLTGTVAPAAANGKVTIKKERWSGKVWKSEGSVTRTVSGGKFSYSFTPAKTGKWHFTATYSGGSVGSTTYKSSKSPTKTVTIK